MIAQRSTAQSPRLTVVHEPFFKIETIEEVDASPDPGWVIDGILPNEGVSMVYGRSGSGKTFLTLDWALHIALGKDWQGRSVKQGPVMYVAAEGGGGVKRRYHAWGHQHSVNMKDIPLHLIRRPINLFREEEVDKLIEDIKHYPSELPRLVVFDTLGRCMEGAVENDNSDMNVVIGLADRIRCELQTAVLLVHHTGRQGSTPRGASSLDGGVAMHALVEERKGGLRLSCGKQKDDTGFEPMDLRLEEVCLPDGKGSLVVMPSDTVLDGQCSTDSSGNDKRSNASTPRRQRVPGDRLVEVIREAGQPLGPTEVAQRLSMKLGAAKVQLGRLVTEKKLVRDAGRYRVV